MSPERYRYQRQKLGSQAKVARMLGVHPSVISKRECGRSPIKQEAALAIDQLVALANIKPKPIRVHVLSPKGRAEEKAASRLADLKAIESGEMTPQEVQRKNSMAPANLRQALANA